MSLQHKYVFGPVPSRRLGLSLGVDIIPSKLCTLDCIYCEVGRTDKRGLARREYIPASEILAEVKEALHEYPHLDHITISGSGEPTLNSKIGDIIRGIKQMTAVPVAVLTNGTLLFLPDVCKDLLDADVVSPSLDAVTQEVFEIVDRPHPRLRIADIIEGLKQFRRQYKGQLWLEILFVKGVNDHDDEVLWMKDTIRLIRPDKVQINTVVRPPAEETARPVSEERLKEIQAILGEQCEIIGVFREKHKTEERNADAQAILALLRRRAMTVDGMAASLAMRKEEIVIALHELTHDGFVKSFTFNGEEFFQSL
jgi:wyosine [tRNA(Phe)-imidazoG37] synthetase (radical SAM superfamily)